MVRLGEISLAFCLPHCTALSTLRKALGTHQMYRTTAGVAMLVGTAAVTVLLSWALHALVEAPLVRRSSRSHRA